VTEIHLLIQRQIDILARHNRNLQNVMLHLSEGGDFTPKEREGAPPMSLVDEIL